MVAAVRESLAELSPWMPWAHENYSETDAAAWVETMREASTSGTGYAFAVLDPAGRYAGTTSISRVNVVDGVANLGYWIRTSLVGRGLASTAVRQLVTWTLANTLLNRLEIVVAVGNLRSQRVAERLGAHRDAVLQKRIILDGLPTDAVLYSILRPD
jgi:RimJ/RimL family protein N-acetyltransferase